MRRVKSYSVLTGIRLLVKVRKHLEQEALRQDCSMAWLVNEALMEYFGLKKEDMVERRLPKTFKERSEDDSWKP